MFKVYCEYVYIDSLLEFMSHYGVTYLSGEKSFFEDGVSFIKLLSKHLVGYFSNNMYGYIPVFVIQFRCMQV
jgi:hypothetical protein